MKRSLPPFCLAVCLALCVGPVFAQKVAPKALETKSPGYPEELADTGIVGQAVIVVTVKADGTVTDPVVAAADQPVFAKAAQEAVLQWKFQPGTKDGVPSDMKVSVPFKFAVPFEQQVNIASKRKVFAQPEGPVLTLKDFGGKLKEKTKVNPIYPRSLARSGVTEKVEVEFVVAPDGTTINPKITKKTEHPEFINAAILTIVRTAYEPPVKDGKPVYVATTKTLRFEEPQQDRGGAGGGRGGRGGGMGGRGGGMGGGGMGGMGGGDDFGGGMGGGMGGGGGGGEPGGGF
jgi:TonB family protein